jgi:hypothetical protein
MFQFPGFAFVPYVFRHKYLLLISTNPRLDVPDVLVEQPEPRLGVAEIEGGFPHSEIRGSKAVRASPRLIAAYHVLHRLSAPRHPPITLKALDRSHYRCSPLGSGPKDCSFGYTDRKTICFEHIRDRRGQADNHNWSSFIRRLLHPRSNDRTCFLFTMTNNTRGPLARRAKRTGLPAPCETFLIQDVRASRRSSDLVEPDGIEPTTSCLQSTRSPN